MKPFPAPTAPGHYWANWNARLVHPKGEEWASLDFEVVQVWDNNGEGNEKWGVSVPGIEPTQWIEDFVWGPRVQVPQIPGFRERTF